MPRSPRPGVIMPPPITEMDSDETIIGKAKALASGLKSPYSPTLCPNCFALFAQCLENQFHATMLLQAQCHTFWDALMGFVSAEWTTERQHGVSRCLLRTRSRCRTCKPARSFGVLKHELPNSDTLFGLVFQLACVTIHHGLIDRLHHNKGFGSKRGFWPASTDQLFPYGPERTLSSLVSLVASHSYAEGVVVSLLLLHRPLAFPVLASDNNRTSILCGIISRLRDYYEAAAADLSRLRSDAYDYEVALVIRPHLKLCQTAALMLHSIAFGTDSRPADKLHFIRGYETDLFDAVDRAAYLASFSSKHAWMLEFATHLWVSLTRAQREAVGQVQPPEYSAGMIAPLDTASRDPYRALQYHLSHRLRIRDCDGPGCGKTVHDKEAPGAFAKCAKCRVAQYCSRECQRADWRDADGRFPHREICDMLQELYTIVELDRSMPPNEWSDACRARAFPLERVETLIAWASQTGHNGDSGKLALDPTTHRDSDSDYFVCVPPTPDHKVFSGHKELEPAQRFKNALAEQGLVCDIFAV